MKLINGEILIDELPEGSPPGDTPLQMVPRIIRRGTESCLLSIKPHMCNYPDVALLAFPDGLF
jgi:hypothetical protein